MKHQYTGRETGSWFDELAEFPAENNSFFGRGGTYGDTAAGTFSFYKYNGMASSYNSFRPVLAP